MKILIIGGTGILSSAVVDECVNRGIDVTMINRGTKKVFLNPNAKLIIADVRKDAEKIAESLKGQSFDAVVDFLIWNEQQLDLSLSLFSKLAGQYVFISSAQAYNTSKNGVLTEDSELQQPLWSYSVNKVICEGKVRNYCDFHKVNYTIIRPGVNYGNTRIPYGMFPIIGKHWTLVSRIKAEKPIITWNNGQNRLNLTRVEDFAKGMVGLLGNPKAYNEAFNVVGDYVYSWMEVLQTLERVINTKVNVIDMRVDVYANELSGDTREGLLGGRSKDLVCSNEKLKSVIGDFTTEFTLEEGLKKTIQFYEDNDYYYGFDYVWDAECDRIINKYRRSKGLPIDKTLRFVSYNKESSFEYKQRKYCYYRNYYKESPIKLFYLRFCNKFF